MTTTLVLLAHPSRQSFNAAWAEASVRALRDMGDTVIVSDLYAMGFDPAERAAHYPPDVVGAPYDVLKTQQAASETDSLPKDIRAEIDKVRQADRIILHFPLWWFAPPAMVKGWCERVLMNGGLHDTRRRFDTGDFKGRSVLFCVTTGAGAAEVAHDGKEGDIRLHLWPLAYTFRYLGYDVLTPRTVHGVHGYHRDAARTALDARLAETLAAHPQTLAGWEDLPRLAFNADGDFDAEGKLRASAPSHSPFIRPCPGWT